MPKKYSDKFEDTLSWVEGEVDKACNQREELSREVTHHVEQLNGYTTSSDLSGGSPAELDGAMGEGGVVDDGDDALNTGTHGGELGRADGADAGNGEAHRSVPGISLHGGCVEGALPRRAGESRETSRHSRDAGLDVREGAEAADGLRPCLRDVRVSGDSGGCAGVGRSVAPRKVSMNGVAAVFWMLLILVTIVVLGRGVLFVLL